MRKWCAVMLVALVGLSGCKREGSLGGPGAPRDTLQGRNQPAQTKDMVFALTLPERAVVVRRGQETKFSLGIHRGSRFHDKVRVDFTRGPKGVTFTPANKGEIAPNQDKIEVTARAAPNATVQETTVIVAGIPETEGKIAENPLSIKVE